MLTSVPNWTKWKDWKWPTKWKTRRSRSQRNEDEALTVTKIGARRLRDATETGSWEAETGRGSKLAETTCEIWTKWVIVVKAFSAEHCPFAKSPRPRDLWVIPQSYRGTRLQEEKRGKGERREDRMESGFGAFRISIDGWVILWTKIRRLSWHWPLRRVAVRASGIGVGSMRSMGISANIFSEQTENKEFWFAQLDTLLIRDTRFRGVEKNSSFHFPSNYPICAFKDC